MRKLQQLSVYGLRLGGVTRIQGIRSELLLGLMVVSDLCRTTGARALITSVLNGEHMHNSLHYVGAAADFVLGGVEDRDAWVIILRQHLGSDFDVIDEGDHIHIEYQPHSGALT